jgi:hypothetical protein
MTLLVFSDGCGDSLKLETIKYRAIAKANRVWNLCHSMQYVCAEDFVARMNIGVYIACLAAVCRELGILFQMCVGEADVHIARVTTQKNHFACVSSDSDFFCLGVPCISFSSVRFKADVVSACLFTPSTLTECLELKDAKLLPHLACLVGNDFINNDDVALVHNMLQLSVQNKSILQNISRWNIVDSVVKFLQTFECVEELQSKLSQSPRLENYFHALEQYNIHIPVDSDMCQQEVLSRLSLKLQQAAKDSSVVVFRCNLPVLLVPMMFQPTQDAPQLHIVSMFANLRSRILNATLAPGTLVEQEQLTTVGETIFKHTARSIPGLF